MSKRAPQEPEIEVFRDPPTEDLAAWRWLWDGDRELPLRSHRGGLMGRLSVFLKRLMRPFAKAPVSDLWERQVNFNRVLIAHLEHLEKTQADLSGNLGRDIKVHHRRLAHLEEYKGQGLEEMMRHSDALYALLEQRLDQVRRQTEALQKEVAALRRATPSGRSQTLSAGEE